jgi:hypothetical protein
MGAMSDINHAQEVRDVLEFYEKHGRDLPAYGKTYKDGTRQMRWGHGWASFAVDGWDGSDARVPDSAVLDLLTMDLMRWAKEVAPGFRIADREIDSVTGASRLWVLTTHGLRQGTAQEHLHRALMAAIKGSIG